MTVQVRARLARTLARGTNPPACRCHQDTDSREPCRYRGITRRRRRRHPESWRRRRRSRPAAPGSGRRTPAPRVLARSRPGQDGTPAVDGREAHVQAAGQRAGQGGAEKGHRLQRRAAGRPRQEIAEQARAAAVESPHLRAATLAQLTSTSARPSPLRSPAATKMPPGEARGEGRSSPAAGRRCWPLKTRDFRGAPRPGAGDDVGVAVAVDVAHCHAHAAAEGGAEGVEVEQQCAARGR